MRRRSHLFRMSVLVCALGVPVRMSAAESAGTLYERAYFLEQGRGDLAAAIKLYRRVAEEFPEDRKLAARALLRIGFCYERLGLDGATQAYRKILERYADQPEARIAREKLSDFEKGREPDIPTGVTVSQIKLKNGKQLFTAGSLSPDGKSVAYYDWETLTLQVQDLRNGQTRLLSRPRVEMPHYELHWSPDGKKIAFDTLVAGDAGDRAAAAVDVKSGERVVYLHLPGAYVRPLDWSRDGGLLCWIGGADGASIALAFKGRAPVLHKVIGEGFRISPDGRHVAFSRKTEEGPGQADIAVIDLTSPDQTTTLAPSPAQDSNPIWSPDGRFLAFRSQRTGSWGLWAVEMSDGKAVGEPFLLQKDIGGEAALDRWLADGRLSYSKGSDLNDVWLLPISQEDGRSTGKSFLASRVQGRNDAPFWSPDGKRLAYTSGRRADGKVRLYITPVERFDELEIELPCDYFNNATWSPDGLRIVVIANTAKGRLFLQYDLTTREASVFLDEPLAQKGSPYGQFSPDGASFLFDAFAPSGDSAGLHVYQEGSLRKIPNTEGARPGRWSPEGRWIAFKRGKSLWLIRPDGSGMREVLRSEIGILPGFTWSPNSRFIAYTRPTSPSIWVLDLDGEASHELPETGGLQPARLAWSPDGKHLAIGSTRGHQQLWLVENLLPDLNGKEARRSIE